MLFICYPKCSTCLKARKWLNEKGFSYTERNIKEQNPNYNELKEWHAKSGLPLKRYFNTSGTYVSLNAKTPEMSEESNCNYFPQMECL